MQTTVTYVVNVYFLCLRYQIYCISIYFDFEIRITVFLMYHFNIIRTCKKKKKNSITIGHPYGVHAYGSNLIQPPLLFIYQKLFPL